MTDFIIKKLPYDLTSNAGLALVGQYFKRLDIGKSLDRNSPSAKVASSTARCSKVTSVCSCKARATLKPLRHFVATTSLRSRWVSKAWPQVRPCVKGLMPMRRVGLICPKR